MSHPVKGYCPMGCGETLFLGAGGHITCGQIDCPHPVAVDQILSVSETEHVVDFTDDGFSILHPLRERLDVDEGGLFGCDLHQTILGMKGPPVRPGRYRATRTHTPYGWAYDVVPS